MLENIFSQRFSAAVLLLFSLNARLIKIGTCINFLSFRIMLDIQVCCIYLFCARFNSVCIWTETELVKTIIKQLNKIKQQNKETIRQWQVFQVCLTVHKKYKVLDFSFSLMVKQQIVIITIIILNDSNICLFNVKKYKLLYN